MRMMESEERLTVKAQMRRGNVPLGFQERTPLLELAVLELESSNPRGALRLRGWRQSRFVLELKRRQGDAMGKC